MEAYTCTDCVQAHSFESVRMRKSSTKSLTVNQALGQPRTQGILLPVGENGPGIGRSHDLKISSIWGVQI
jgi:hypothetical protein